jgi:hypothetical protein
MDPNRFKREESDFQRKLSTPAMVSPLHPHPAPAHSHGTHQSPPVGTKPGSLAGLLSPPESRRTSGDEKEAYKPAARQSLPSISEALGAPEQPLPYAGPVPPPPSVPAPTSQHYAPTPANISPSESRLPSQSVRERFCSSTTPAATIPKSTRFSTSATLRATSPIFDGATQPKTAITASYQNYAVSTTPCCSPDPAIFCISTSAAGSLRSPGVAASRARQPSIWLLEATLRIVPTARACLERTAGSLSSSHLGLLCTSSVLPHITA